MSDSQERSIALSRFAELMLKVRHAAVQKEFLESLLIICAHGGDECDDCPTNKGLLMILKSQDQFTRISVVIFHELYKNGSAMHFGLGKEKSHHFRVIQKALQRK